MGRPAKRGKIKLTGEEIKHLQKISRSRVSSLREVERAKIILLNQEGKTDKGIAKQLGLNRLTVKKCLDKCCLMGVEAGLNDLPRSGAPREISDDEMAWVVNLACQKPTEFGYSYELWTYSLLLQHIHAQVKVLGLGSLSNLSRSKLWDILNEAEVRPHKIRYYLEKRDSCFEEKMTQLLYVYKEVEITNQQMKSDEHYKPEKITVSYDEKPGIQAIGNTTPDLLPEPGKYKTLCRDSEYIRHGTLSLLGGIDLHNGRTIVHISETHKSSDFVAFLGKLDKEYDSGLKIRLILDNHSAHISKETKKYLATMPNRFEFVFTPKHGSWLNLIESFFGKMARSFLRDIRVSCLAELKMRIELFIEEINNSPVVFRWKYKMSELVV